MKTTTVLSAALASTALASAQVKYEDGKYICEQENAAYCAGDSLGTDIIIRCNGKVGQPGRCSNNLVGQPPLGVYPASCWQTSQTSGDAACEKNCVVYGSSGNYDGTFTLPTDVCTPTYTASASSSQSTDSVPLSSSSSGSGSGVTTTTHTTQATTTTTTICPPSITETISAVNPTSSPTTKSSKPPHSSGTSTALTTVLTGTSLWSTKTTAPTNPSGGVPSGSGSPSGNGTSTRTGGGGGPIATAGAAVNQAAGALVLLGGVVVFWL